MQSRDLLSPTLEVDKTAYLDRLDRADRNNLILLGNMFSSILKQKGLKGALVAFGGTFTKPLPRKDIDTALIVNSPRQEIGTEYQRAMDDFRFIMEICREVASTGAFAIDHSIEPLIDEEFGSESILRHDGGVTLKAQKGVPIDVIHKRDQTIDDFVQHNKGPYSVIQVFS